jgi:hypothetical protein
LLKTAPVRSLHEVVAIQCLRAGWIGMRRRCRVNQFQINLVLESPPAFRLNVCTEPDEAFVRDMARDVATFLGVPVVERNEEEP